MNTKIKYKNFVLYGSQTGEVNDSIYRQLLQKIQKPQTTSSIQFLNANPLNLEETIQKLKEPTYFFPLFLMKGIEYSNFTSSIQKNFRLENIIEKPLTENKTFLDIIFTGNVNSIFLMHGSSRYENLEKHKDIISFGGTKGFAKFCFLEGSNPYKELIQNEIVSQMSIEITPLFFTRGKHLQTDLIDNFLKNYPQSKWQVNSCLLEREDIVSQIVKIANQTYL